MNVDVLEHALIQISATRVVGLQIVLVGASKQVQARAQVSSDDLFVDVELAQVHFRRSPLGGDPALFSLEVSYVESIGIERIHEFLALAFQLPELVGSRLTCGQILGEYGVQVIQDESADLGDGILAQCHARPVLIDERFELMSLDGSELAAVLVRLAPETVEVVVEDALSIPALLERERFAALAAVDGSFEVVAVYSRLFPALVTRRTHSLDFAEQLLGDERWVFAGVFNAFERHDADVVALLQNAVDVGIGDWSARSVGARNGADTSGVQLLTQHCYGPVSGRVSFIDPGNPV